MLNRRDLLKQAAAFGTAALSAKPQESALIRVFTRDVQGPASPYLTGVCLEDVNHEVYGGIYSQMVFGESFQEPGEGTAEISRMWRAVQHGTASGRWALEADFTGSQSQRIGFESGEGEIGIENQGLNRWGMYFAGGKPYQGYLWAKAEKPVELTVALENADGSHVHATASMTVAAPDWQRIDFTLTPTTTETRGRLAIKLHKPGSVVLGHVFLQPGEWGRFKGLPVRRDVAEALVNQGITVMRYGGSLVNVPEYRWKKMIGPRDRRPPYKGKWYPYTSNGWGILDFLNFCEAAGFLAIPAFHMGESAQDMADFVEYVNGAAGSEWGRKRAADGHPTPYNLRHLELGNEERVDDAYFSKFKEMAEAVWAKDPKIILVVGDFNFRQPIRDPFNLTGAASKITTMAAHRKILELAREQDREVWFDVHVTTDRLRTADDLAALPSYIRAIDDLAAGAKHKTVVFELNANIHSHRRGLANAHAINRIERLGTVPVVCSANCLQPDGPNDNGWDQGLLFLNPSKVWLQSPGYVTQMLARNRQPLVVKTDLQGTEELDATAKRSEDGKTLVLQVVNRSEKTVPARIDLDGMKLTKPSAKLEELAGPPDAVNTAAHPQTIKPRTAEWHHAGSMAYEFPPYSFTVLRFE
jgi:alpha-L-arabinofuranosidase